MPGYEFQCKKCSTIFDERETFREHDEHKQVKCPKCGSTDVEQVLTPSGVKTAKKS
jgi:putative FmdB family regulatory protein